MTTRNRALVALDTSCLVPLLCEWHEFHQPTIEAVSEYPIRNWLLCSHVLLECFAVLTRLPGPHRVPPADARALLAASFADEAAITEIAPEDVWAAIDRTAGRGFGGGKVYDAIIAHSAARCGASVLLTWNVRDFLAVAPADLEIRQPGEG